MIIERIKVDDITRNPQNYNTNNHGTESPKDYYDVLSKTHTNKWIDIFHKDQYKTFDLSRSDLYWMIQAFEIGRITGKFPKSFSEELKLIEDKYKFIVPDEGYFVRTEKVSLKYGCHGCGPYFNIREIVESICTTTQGHRCIDPDDITCRIYLMKWRDDISFEKEFRVFVHNNKITAISQQALHIPINWFYDKSNNELVSLSENLCKYFNDNIQDKMSICSNSYVMDIAYIRDDLFYFIEPNSFGKEYAAGSALFHWLNDYNIIYGNEEEIHFRLTIP